MRTAGRSFSCTASSTISLPSTILRRLGSPEHARAAKAFKARMKGDERVLEAGILKGTSRRSQADSDCSTSFYIFQALLGVGSLSLKALNLQAPDFQDVVLPNSFQKLKLKIRDNCRQTHFSNIILYWNMRGRSLLA